MHPNAAVGDTDRVTSVRAGDTGTEEESVVDQRSTVERVLAVTAEQLDRVVGWSRLPKPLGLAVLVGIRSQLRALNLVDTDPDPAPPLDPPLPASDHRKRTIDGRFDNLAHPDMGSVGTRFGRNVPLDATWPELGDRFREPSPRVVSEKLLARTEFQPAETLNLLAAAWIQFQVHDWVSHLTPPDPEPWLIELDADDQWPHSRPMQVPRTPTLDGPADAPPTYANRDTHWWDASQIYGDTEEYAAAIRDRDADGNLLATIELADDGLPTLAAEQLLDKNGPKANSWLGLALMQSLFLREHNAICRRLTVAHPEFTADQERLYNVARLVNSALMAKIHTVDWTPAIIAHPTTVTGMHANWFGLLGEKFTSKFGRLVDSEILFGIPGGGTHLDGVPFSLTEEFVAVYRMHPLLPDHLDVRSLATGQTRHTHPLGDLLADKVHQRMAEWSMDDLLYSFGRAFPGALTLHNFPEALRDLPRPDAESIDLATIDVLRSRERGVPRYNEFRRHFRLPPAKSFADLTNNAEWAKQLEQMYRDIDDVDLMIGLYAERKPRGFGFSDTAFRVFILMASRRIAADRFLTTDFTADVYTEAGMAWIRDNTMRTVLLRHFPTLTPVLAHATNPFAPWPAP
ncbi:peroxidase family protein [Gordonia sputi]|uniref:Putative peroxidase n=1 Tax=Gordonia sputi NBRC 100414 TaxID=1089453 RepID=H5TWM1_9ACTN|nr:peroxidase [Gordonia sputi]GAB37879.1 putative peroxidase [Gordonia sputi NBRC 100414]